MKLSRHFRLGKTQHELSFVDIDLDNDTPLFIDPHFLSIRTDRWSVNATRTVRNFFRHFLTLVRNNNRADALTLFEQLGEPNETRLGLSKGKSQGRSVGAKDSGDIFDSLLKSKAVASGLVEDIEDCRLFVDNISFDKVSDMTTNIIREHLIAFTKNQCNLLGIPLTNAPSGSIWDNLHRRWVQRHDEMLIVGGRVLLLVPKAIVGFSFAYTPQKYYQHFVLNFLQAHHLQIKSALVKRRVNKKRGTSGYYVTKKSIKDSEAPYSKDFLITFTEAHRGVFERFKQIGQKSLPASELSSMDISTVADRLATELQAITPGAAEASRYHSAVLGILELVFYPRLINPLKEREVNGGRKRIDIVMDNAATEGFFHRAHATLNTVCPFIQIEVKNYSNDLGNGELDQLLARFTLQRGRVGLIVCRNLIDHRLFMRRCADAYQGQQGIAIPLVDADLLEMLNQVKRGNPSPEETVLASRFREIALV